MLATAFAHGIAAASTLFGAWLAAADESSLTSSAEAAQHQDHQHHQHQEQAKPGHQDHAHDQPEMRGTFGRWPMSQEGSGTAWLPADSPMYMRMLPKSGRYSLNLMGIATVNWADAGGPRGESQLFSNSMIMLMADRETGGGNLGLRGMFSADPITNGKKGYPNLFQTGETANGEPLKDRQHPHDLISELAVSYSKPLSDQLDGFIYAGIVGEPALGAAMYLHRPSTWDNPEAPISHHWFDSTHISYGVLTLGVASQGRWKLEGSLFNGHEPDEERFDIDPIQLNSASARVTYNPNPNWSFSAAYGFLDSPEILEPGINQNRITAAAQYNRSLSNGDNFAAALLYGRNIKRGHHDPTDAFVLEGTYSTPDTAYFARAERVDKDELVDVPHDTYTINKYTIGAVHNLLRRDGFEYGLGFHVSAYSFPKSLEPFYGKNPISLGLFLRIRPERMRH